VNRGLGPQAAHHAGEPYTEADLPVVDSMIREMLREPSDALAAVASCPSARIRMRRSATGWVTRSAGRGGGSAA
jgi:hypothetical protein